MASPLRLLSVALEHVPETDESGQPYPWARPLIALQSLVRDVADKVNAMPWVAARTVSYTFTAGEAKALVHGLGRTPVRWAPLDVIDGYGSFCRTAWDATSITIQSENAVTATFIVG